MREDKIIVALFLALSIFAALYAHINQGLRLELARAEERVLDERGVVGWWMMDEKISQLYFIRRKP